MIIAVEIDALLNKYGNSIKKSEISGFTVYQCIIGKNNIYAIHSGAGEIYATMATQFLITEFKVDMVVNYGIAGGLTKDMNLTRTCIVEKVVHYDFDTSEVDNVEVGRYLEYPDIYLPTTKNVLEKALEIDPSLKKVTCASGDKFISKPEKKAEMHNNFKADICEMEAAGIVLTCNRNNIPCLLIKTISDSITGGAEEFTKAANETGAICIDITSKIIDRL